MDSNDSPVSGETITVWYRQENKKFIAYRCQVKRASAKQGLLIDHIDVDKNDPEKESYLDPKDAHWLIGDWREYETKDAAQYVKANLRADAISDRLRSADVSLNAEQVRPHHARWIPGAFQLSPLTARPAAMLLLTTER